MVIQQGDSSFETGCSEGGIRCSKIFKSLTFWPRPESYYHRNNWAGKLKDPDGKWVLDSPVQNATAHFLHNSLYVLGKQTERSAVPSSIEIEAFRAYPIENYDTAALRCVTDSGVQVLHYASHTTKEQIGPLFEFEFENARVTFAEGSQNLIARFNNGNTKSYGSPMDDPYEKVLQTIDAVRNDKPTLCGIEAATPLTLCVNGGQESITGISTFPSSLIKRTKKRDTLYFHVEGLGTMLKKCYTKGLLPSEHSWPYAQKATPVSLLNYSSYPTYISST
ncbi:MAG: hypothetical protein GF401_14875 [Chitinivibrionales bacterium]|nr:hypothetical protein [Chitinivibrionales bacterium]